MKVEPLSTMPNERKLKITPQTTFEEQWLREFMGGGGPAGTWEFLKQTDREMKMQINGYGQTITSIDLDVEK